LELPSRGRASDKYSICRALCDRDIWCPAAGGGNRENISS